MSFPLFQIGTVCDDRFSDTAAHAICKEIGYQCALEWHAGDNWITQESYPIALDNVYCETENFTQCTYDTSHNCGHAEDVFLTCTDRCLTGDGLMRAMLVDSEGLEISSGQGLLLVTSSNDDVVSLYC